MTSAIESRLSALGVTIPENAPPMANYVPFTRSGNILFVSGQISLQDGEMIKGRLGENMTTEEGALAARACAINLLSQVKSACDGDLNRLKKVLKLVGFVNSTPDFGEQPAVINGASDFLVEVLGDVGKHARSAVSAGALPFGVAVEIEGIFEIE